MNVDIDIDYDLALARCASTFTTLQSDLLAALATKDAVAAGLIAPLLGLEHHAQLNLAISGIAKKLARAVGIEPPKRADGSNRWWQIVATGRDQGGRFYWMMRPALREAVVRLGLLPDTGELYPEVVGDHGPPLMEGTMSRIVVNAYERNPVARRRCIEHHGSSCTVCGFDFGAFYGPITAGVIHVHHLRPVSSEPGESRVVDPIEDLRPVCPNCHVVLHRREPPLSIDEARALVAARGGVDPGPSGK